MDATWRWDSNPRQAWYRLHAPPTPTSTLNFRPDSVTPSSNHIASGRGVGRSSQPVVRLPITCREVLTATPFRVTLSRCYSLRSGRSGSGPLVGPHRWGNWCRREGSNPGHPAYKTGTLPTELQRQMTDGYTRGLSARSGNYVDQLDHDFNPFALSESKTPGSISRCYRGLLRLRHSGRGSVAPAGLLKFV